jgi:hypothetical protein
MSGLPALRESLSLPGGASISLAGLYAPGNLALEARHDQADLPRSESLRLADLHGLMTTFQSIPRPADAWKLYVLVVTQDADDPDTLGIMFDFGANDANDLPREGCAIFATAHEGLPANGRNPQEVFAQELFLTTAHELAHCFNLHHPDWEGTRFKHDATIESYSLSDSVRWSLSPQSLKHLRSAPRTLVQPGAGGLPFGLLTDEHLAGHKPTPLESFEVVEVARLDTLRRGLPVAKTAAVRAALARSRASARGAGPQPLELTLQAPKRSFVIGEAVVLTVSLKNTATTPWQVNPLLSLSYRFLNLEIRAPGAQTYYPFRPAVLAEARGRRSETLQPGEALYEEAKVFFGADGWTFSSPGRYALRADYPAGAARLLDLSETEERVLSEVLELEITAAASEPDRRAQDLILGPEAGLYLLLEGGDHLKRAAQNLQAIAREAPTAAQAPAAKLALALGSLHPTVDPERRARPSRRVDEAEEYLRELPTTSLPTLGVLRAQARLADSLLERGKAGDQEKAQHVQQTIQEQLAKEPALQTHFERFKRRAPPR